MGYKIICINIFRPRQSVSSFRKEMSVSLALSNPGGPSFGLEFFKQNILKTVLPSYGPFFEILVSRYLKLVAMMIGLVKLFGCAFINIIIVLLLYLGFNVVVLQIPRVCYISGFSTVVLLCTSCFSMNVLRFQAHLYLGVPPFHYNMYFVLQHSI
jgi:hypothetical protein